jgi:IPT/TIG domain
MRPVKMLCAAAMVFGLVGCSNDLKVTSVEPVQGTFGGGEDVVIHGNGFQPGRGGVTVTFGKRPATSVVVAAADKISVLTPGGDPNTTVDVTVVFDDGKAFKLANGFHYMAPADQRGTLDKAFNSLGKDNPNPTPTTPPTPPPAKK